MMILIIARLYNMQIINGEGYKNLSDQRISANITKKAPRGEITDRNGVALVTNRKGYTLKIRKVKQSDKDINNLLISISKVLEKEEKFLPDSLPISKEKPYKFTFENEKEKNDWFLENKALDNKMSAKDVVDYYKEKFETDGLSETAARNVIGARYDMRKMGFSINNAYTVASDVSVATITKIKECSDEFENVEVSEDYFREYTNVANAAHILGRVGKIYKEEYDELKNSGYGMNDLVGKEGIEKICEKELRGTDGTESAYYGKDKELLGDNTEISAIPGNSVALTIDANLQKVAEESLERNIKEIASRGSGTIKGGGDANAGAAIVIDVNTGEILAMASYPTFNLDTFSQNYEVLSNDKAKPLWNRVISGTYTPGSTFKPLTAIAALSTGSISENEQITCEGVYKFYKDYQPKCWIWSEQHMTHGSINVSRAIVDSCNYFFYEVGRRTGIDAIDEYAKKFGLGEKTGIELSGEVAGNVASPQYKKTLYKDDDDKKWVAGDTIQTAIGQSYSNFTPIGIVNYVATIANGGKRYKPHLIKSIRSTTDGTMISENKPELLKEVRVEKNIFDAVKNGMKGVTDEGSAKKIFEGYPIEVGGKTGTAQISKNSSNNALFVSFAPFDKPEIAVCVVIEHGFRGANAAYVARDIYDQYFGLNKIQEETPQIKTTNDIFGALLP